MIIEVHEVHVTRYQVDAFTPEEEALELVRNGKARKIDSKFKEQAGNRKVKIIRIDEEQWWSYIWDRTLRKFRWVRD